MSLQPYRECRLYCAGQMTLAKFKLDLEYTIRMNIQATNWVNTCQAYNQLHFNAGIIFALFF